MDMFRAVPTQALRASYPLLTTKRVPSNVPYLVDNIWEWLRGNSPEQPCRRYATFASPSRELALEAAGAKGREHEFSVGRVALIGAATAVQIEVPDARFHHDVKKLPSVVRQWAGQPWIDGSLKAKLELAALFLPAVDAEEVDQLLERIPRGRALADRLRAESNFWAEARPLRQPLNETPYLRGEFFFVAPEGYKLDLRDSA